MAIVTIYRDVFIAVYLLRRLINDICTLDTEPYFLQMWFVYLKINRASTPGRYLSVTVYMSYLWQCITA